MDRVGLGMLIICVCMGGLTATMAQAKKGRTWYTDERLAVMEHNLDNYQWARDYRDNLLRGVGEERPWRWGGHAFSVEIWAARDRDFFWDLMPSTTVTGVYDLDKYGVSPRHGTAVRQGRAFYHPWNYDPFNNPYKIQDPIDGEWYPSNDFASGDMTSGPYPDDGTGMIYEGKRYFPIREYAIATYLYCVLPLMERMSQAYLLTGDPEYAHKCAILMAKVAHEYPNPTDKADRCQKYPWGLRSGLVTDAIWETFKLTSMALSYDALYDHIGQDTALVEYLKVKGLPVETPEDVRKYIEQSIFRIGMLALKEHVIRGNEGHHQETAMALALVMDDHESTDGLSSKDIVEWAMYGDGGMAYIMSNGLFRDGGGFESPGYNEIKFDFIRASRLFEQLRSLRPDMYPTDAYPDIWQHPKARAMFDWFIDMRVLNRFTPTIGDTGGGTLVPRAFPEFGRYSTTRQHYDFGYERYGDPRYARVFIGPGDNLPPGNPFEPYIGEQLLQSAQGPEAQIVKQSRIVDGYGVAFLCSGQEQDARCLVLNYSNHFQHGQYDRLSLGLYHQFTDCLPALGYPFTWDYRTQWDANLYTKNTVVVDEAPGKYLCPAGRLVMMGREGPLQAVAAAHDPYMHDHEHNPDVPPVRLYERTCVMVDVSDTEYYVVDLFAVSGGTQHDQSWHGPICPVENPNLPWEQQPTGTLAGPDVELFGKWTDRWGREMTGPFSYLQNVSRVTTSAPACFTWNMQLEHQGKLRLTVVPVDGPVELVRCDGRSPARPPDWSLDFLMVRRSVDEGAATRFLTVIDTRAGEEPTVRGARIVATDPLTIVVTHSGGTDELVLNVPTAVTGPFEPRGLGVILKRGAQAWRIGKSPGVEDGYLTGTIVACDYQRNSIEIAGIAAADLQGRHARIYTSHRSSAYRIVEAQQLDDERLRLHLEPGSHLFELRVSGFDDGKLHNSTSVQTWTARERDGVLVPFRIWNRDAVIVSEDGKTVRTIDAFAHGRTLYLEDSPSAARLQSEFTDANGDGRITANAYDYGVGAQVEIAVSTTD